MKNKFNFLVTGCGGDIGQSIGKILNEYSVVKSLYGIDINNKNVGQFIYKHFSLGLNCEHEDYLLSIESFIKKNNIDFIIPLSEPELRFFSEKNINKVGTAQIISASSKAQKTGFDKLKTVIFLKENKFPYPKTSSLNEEVYKFKYPLILKSREGSGSSKVHLIEDKESFNFFKKLYPDFIKQEYIDNTEGEYTCCVFRSSKKELRSIIFKRILYGGYTSYGKVVENKNISNLIEEISKKLDLRGSINIQLRMKKNKPYVFEINPRFSSTVLFRHMLGFNDLIWSIEDAIGIDISPYVNDNVGKEFFKGFAEYIK
tara:strand:- start:24 stop:968 length:945 start_codon:yes stop_codon:yes gene_type:complete